MRARPTRPLLFTMICWLTLAAACASNDLTGPQPVPQPDDTGTTTRDAGDPTKDADVVPDAAPDAEADVVVIPECTGDAQCPPGSFCDTAELECVTDCANDEGCEDPLVCDITRGRCIDAPESCGDGACVAADGEDCFCDVQAGEDCGTCGVDCGCDSANKCVANSCIPRCGDGLCEASENCESCPQDCGCDAGQACQDSMCVCDDSCSNGDTDCVGNAARSCVADVNGCYDYGAAVTCPSGICTNGSCCTPQCGNQECGADGCGGNCGTCGFACGNDSNCTRRLTINYVEITDCRDACNDFGLGNARNPDPRLEVVVGTDTYRSDGPDDSCGQVLGGTIVGGANQTFTKTQLQSVLIRVQDADSFLGGSDDLCAQWMAVDLSAAGTRLLTSTGDVVKVSITTSN